MPAAEYPQLHLLPGDCIWTLRVRKRKKIDVIVLAELMNLFLCLSSSLLFVRNGNHLVLPLQYGINSANNADVKNACGTAAI